MPFSSTANDLTTLAALKAWLGIPDGEILPGAISVSNGGSAYATPPTVAFTNLTPGAVAPTAAAVISGGVVIGVTILTSGRGHASAPTVGFSGGGGSGAVATVQTSGIARIDNQADVALARLITSASNFILAMLGRPFLVSQAVTEKYDGNGGSRLFVKSGPVTAVAAAVVDGVAIPAASLSFGDHWIEAKDGYFFPRGEGNVQVTYTAGYVAGESYELLTLEQGVLELCAQKWKRRAHVDESSKTLGQVATVFSQRDMPAEVRTLVNQFRSVVPA